MKMLIAVLVSVLVLGMPSALAAGCAADGQYGWVQPDGYYVVHAKERQCGPVHLPGIYGEGSVG